MHIILLCSFVFLHGFGLCISSYAEGQEAQSDVQAPAYVPAYLKNQKFSNANYSGRKVSYAGTKTGYAGTKTGYTGTKTGYTGTKSGYTKSPYGEKRSWDTNYGHGPTYEDFHNSANQPYMAKCVPDCLNNGICVATNTCQCPANYRGQYCELERKPCLVYPPLPMNSNRTCSSDFCTIQCLEGHKFIDGSTVANMRCVTGQWMPTRADFITLPDCLPECAPRCENGGVCLALNTCQCPEDYRGPQCQYAASVCDMRKLAFNGGYSCFGDADKFSCKLNCPAGASYSSPRAPVYACRYDTGVFEPQPIPHCVFNDAFVVVPSNYRNGSSSYYESHTWQTSSEGHSSSGHGGSSHGNWGSGLYHHSQHSGQSGQSQVVVQDFTPKGGTCLTWAGVHYKTFDGKIYSFKSPCRHILVRDLREHRFAVAVRPGACARRGYCPSEITVYLEEKPYVLSVHPEDNSVVFRSSKRLIPIPASLPGIRVAMPADHVIVNLDAAGLTLKWDTNDVIVIESSVLLWNNTEGLCGSLNSNMDDDLTTKEGTRAQTTPAMASSWQLNRIEDICESNPMELKSCSEQSDDTKKKAFQFCTTIFSKDKFRKCSAVMDVSLLLAACQGDYCACTSSENPEECACSTVSVHARECLRHGVEEMKYWRDPETCPKTCSDGKLYRVCGSDAQPTCAFPQPGGSNATCVEGCFCPDGLLLEAGRCIPKEECPCRLRNKSFKPGKVIPKDCNTCKCSSGAWSCTQAACGARCGAAGDPHYTTFDGRRYDFMGRCTYTLLQTKNVTIEVENVACSGSITEAMNLPTYTGEGKPSCTKAVNLIYEGANIHLKQGGLILVNGREVSALPVSVAGVRIRAASSLFIIVQLPMKMDLWWDGNTRVFVDVPAEFQGKTKGLCGTFNLNQKDDFLTPEGDVEQSTLAFANKWKTREFCADLDTKEPEHPCKANMENKEAAEKYCSKLKSKLFEECHWYVDVEPYYDACLYDMCACAGDVTRCLCPLLGNYAMDCAKAGVRVQWRYNVKECELQCTGGQEYTVCADSCLRTCTDVALAAAGARCKPCCVEGCACPAGQVLDDTNACVPQGLCPCNHKGMKFDAGYKEVRAGSRERELCTCVGARWECVPATDGDVQNYPPAEDLRANCSAADHKEFTTCELEEPLTCKNMHLPPSPASMECRPGCQCKQGFVLDSGSGRCVAAERCPCHHGGRSYPDGRAMQEECNQCVCKSGNWSCTSRACAGVCAAWGDSHVDTFDAAAYDFEGVCTYLLAKGCMDSSDGFDVEIQNVPCGTTGATCSKTTTLKVGGGGGQEVVALTKDAPLPDVSKLKRIKLRVAGAYVFLDVPSLGVSLQWDRGLRVYVRVDAVWRNRVKGLCGNYNGDTRDDFQTPAGGGLPEANALVFADAWKLKAACPKPKPVADYCVARPHRKEWAVTVCGSMKRHPFSLCASEVPAGPYVERCERDACACDSGADCDCACAALAAYAYACSLRGVTFDWRSQQLCPMQCDEECSNYDGCVSACPLETCDNTADYTDLKGSCQLETCVEGCKPKKACPEGSVYSNHTLSECVPRAKCKPVCMTLEDGTEVLEGEVIEEDACHTCRCSKEHKVCTGQPCSTETVPPEASSPKPHDEPLKCISGWSPWVSVHTPTVGPDGASLEQEPLPKQKDLQIGSPMCSKEMMTDIECRTKVNHESPKQTGLDAECSLERGLLCRERGGTCPDFEIRVLCECEPFQCLNATRPSYQHPRDCAKFYECTPDMADPAKPHTVLKSCSDGTLYNPATMICDWPAAVYAVRSECADTTVVPPGTTPTVATKAPTSTEPSTSRRPSTTTVPSTSTIPSTSTEQGTSSACPAGMAWADCAHPCDQLCEHFKETLLQKGVCAPGEKCVAGCVGQKCEKGFRWRDEKTCVPVKDCTCYSDGKIVKPGGVVTKGCVKCQCLANEMHCDSSDCISTTEAPNHLPIVLTTVPPTTVPPTTLPPTTVPTTTVAPTTVTPLIVKNTASPPPECAPDGYKYLLWGSEAEPQPILSASSEASAQFAPEFAVLDGRPNAISAGSWNPASNDVHQYLQVELPRPQPLYGVVLQGSPLFDQFVTSYQLMFSDDGAAYSYATGKDGAPTVFRGPVDHTSSMKQMLSPPVEAKYLRVQPLTWHEEIAIRLQLIGCEEALSTTPEDIVTTPEPMQCTEPLGLGADLPIESIEVSSNNDARRHLRLESARGWRPAYGTPGEWLMFDFTSPRNLTGIKTKGGPQGWVTSYEVRYTSDLSTFNPVIDNSGEPKLFPANFDADSEVLNQFKMPIHARYLKILPVKWHNAIEMRVEPIGCFEPYPVTEPPAPPAQGTTVSCNVCPGVRSAACVCGGRVHYDGERCVPRDQCPCARGYLTYPVGSSFRGENCDECMCKIGGVTDCQPVKECKCAPTLVPKLVEKPSCSCVCEPCPAGTRICPTSKLCLPVVKWCDGLQDCPDDERDCATPSTTPTTPTTTKTTIEPEVVTTVVPTVAAVATTVAVTTPKPVVCPVVECPPGYMVKFVSSSQPARAYTADLPPPRPRHSYQRYYRGAKGGYSKGGYSKGGYSKGGFSKGGYSGPPRPPGANQAFTLDKPSSTPAPEKQQACAQFKCIPRLPPPPRPGTKPAAPDCSAPACPKDYTLHLDRVPVEAQQCPQYSCVPPPERPTYCNVTGRVVSTFDGAEYKYELCYHILARDTRHDAWSVLVRKKCRVDGCRNELIVHQDDQLIKVKPDLMIEYDNYEYTVEQTAKICFQRNSFDVARLGNGLAVTSRKYNFTVLFGADGDIKIGVLKQYMGFVDGLCGAFDGSLRNERRMPDGLLAASAEQMARAWGRPGLPADACSVRVASEADQKRAWDLCNVITKEPLSRCGKVLNLDKWRNICLEKICQCKDLIKNGTKRSEEECRCQVLEQLVAECLAADREADVSAWRMQMDCPAECPPPLVHKDCYRRRCEPSCSSLGVNSCPAEDGQCFPGCYCPDGMLRQGERCIAPRECRDCVCKGDGTPADYTTFEGFTFPFLGNCTYLASRDRNETGVYRYEVYATNGPCEDNLNVTCTKAIHVVYDKKVIDITRDPASKKLVTTVDKEPVFMYPLKKSWVTVSLLNGQDISVLLTDASVEVTVQQSKLELSVLVPSFSYANRTEGLCGVCAGPSAQLLTSNGTGTDDFQEYGKSWQATPSALATLNLPEDQQQCDQPPPPPPCPQPDDNPCFKLYDADAFGQCHALVDPEPFVESCEEERCAMNRSDACAPLQRYAAACRAQAVCLRWRREALCPYHCSEPLVYRPCVDCERTCENYDELAKEPAKCTAPQAEGCFCPEGKVRVNNTCIEPTKCFPCDAEKTHFAGDEWQEDACNKCTCSKSPTESSARVSCTAQTCAAPLCASGEDLVQKPAPPGVVRCCPEYMCVPKLQEQCEEPKKMECGFGQVLKQKTTANGCNEFVCECKPASSCAEIPPASEVELEPGMERVVEAGGCCPRLRLVCRRDACPQPPHCPKFHELQTRNDTAKCCPTYECEPPKDKCIVSLEWEASPKGGEKARAKPEEMLKDVDETWMDGPCRWCRCSSSLLGARTACSATECPAALAGAELLVVEPRPQPYACCPQLLAVACRDGDRVYRPGENWTSPTDPCAKFSCEADAGGRLQRRATTTSCDTHCQPGWEYVPAAAGGGRCCGRCGAAACAAAGALHPIGSSWSSADRCTNYTCLLTNGTLQVQSANESCPSIPAAMEQQFVFSDEPVAGQCCHAREPTACRVGNLIYQEGQTWPSPDPCKNITCSRDAAARLTHAESVQSCARDCARGWVYKDPPEGVCCGKCVQDSCLSDDQLWQPGSTWQSADNCTTFSCTRTGDELLVSAAKEVCPDVSSCDPEDLVNDTCCQLCQEKPQALSTCAPAAVGGAESVGAVRWASRGRPCANAQPLQGFYECKGTCDSGTLYNNVTGIHDSKCECCQAVAYGSLDVVLACEGGAQVLHRVATPTKCACAPCSGGSFSGFTNRPTKTGGAKNDRYTDSYDYDVPEMYQRMKLPEENAQK